MSTTITIYHNPACGTSRDVLQAIRDAGLVPTIVDYRRVGWSRAQLESLFAAMGAAPRDLLRVRGTRAEQLGLTDAAASQDTILDAMVADPMLVERPIVVAPAGTRLCRPADRVHDLLA